jgi:type IV pilus assembly protein PilB
VTPTEKALELLGQIDVFSMLDLAQLKVFADIAKPCQYTAGQPVFRQGDASESFHVVLAGKLDCYLWDDLLKIERPLTTFQRGDIFGEVGLLTDETRSACVRSQTASETLSFGKSAFFELLESQPKVLMNFARILAHRLASANKSSGLKFDQLARYKIGKDLIQMLPLQVILRHRVLPISRTNGEVVVAAVDPADLLARNTAAQFLTNYRIAWVCISQPDFDRFRDKSLFDLMNLPASPVEQISTEITYALPAGGATTLDADSPAAKTLDDLIAKSIDGGASDLHFEPGPQTVTVRARVDGRLIELASPMTLAAYKPIASRIKVLADMDITEVRLPQDAAIRLRYGGRNVDLRVSTVPAPHGESVACRLFDPSRRKFDVDSLVVSEAVLESVRDLFCLPSGLVLVTGPTGSGKTTTLYAGLRLRQMHAPTQKIVTAEDPIEYELLGTTQVQVNLAINLNFERILRSLLRQDPNVILVGEIRDQDSMQIAIEASLTGHFVMSSLHTNDAFETVMRLRQRGVPPYLVASSLRGIISQRLVPGVCGGCMQLVDLPAPVAERLRRSGILKEGEAPLGPEAKGCSHCKFTGQRGRVGLYEVLLMTPELRRSVEHGASLSDLERSAPPGSFVPMRRYGYYLLSKGLVAAGDLLEVLPPPAVLREI